MNFDPQIEIKDELNIQVSDRQYNKQLYNINSKGKLTYSKNKFNIEEVILVGEPNTLVILNVTSSLLNEKYQFYLIKVNIDPC